MWENFAHFDPYDSESTKGTFDFFEACTTQFAAEKGLPAGMERKNATSTGADGYETQKSEREKTLSASPQPLAYQYQQKIKEILDPNDLGDGYYLTLDDQED